MPDEGCPLAVPSGNQPAPAQQQPVATPPSVTPTAAPIKLPTRRMTPTISELDEPESLTQQPTQQQPCVVLDDQTLPSLWAQAVQQLAIPELSRLFDDETTTLQLADSNTILITTHNVFLQSGLSPYRVKLLTLLRQQTGNERLQCDIKVLIEPVERKAYNPTEKYNEMVNDNPSLARFRQLFSQLDF